MVVTCLCGATFATTAERQQHFLENRGAMDYHGSLANEGAKGTKGAECARTVCTNPNAQWFNQSTEKYYCARCARVINELNRFDTKRLYGTDNLCIKEEL